ncbi:FAD-binding domain-containing protein [Fomes fomentarius]|nr:FAD-binding domain-containing protein [Fomes fomentarius]
MTKLWLLFLLGLVQHDVLAATPGRSCRCLYGEPCWPSPSDIAKLAASVPQPLLFPEPPASPCYSSTNSSGCADVIKGWTDGNWRADQPGAMQSPNFETYILQNGTIDTCYLNTTLWAPCGQGSVSAIGVDARSPKDIELAVKFAARHNLRLVVKNTGHDLLGRSAARGSLLLWTHNLKNITVHPTFTPSGAPASETYTYALTLEAGVQWHEAYAAADAANRTLVGGVSAGGSVGAAGGWLLGGGHSVLSPSYGLGVDNVLEISVVTSSGAHLIANAHQHSDLFWALRGGGGGTFGVVTSVTYRTRPSTPVVGVFLIASVNGTQPNAPLSQSFKELVRITPQLTDAGWGGYLVASSTNDTLSTIFFGILPNASWKQANATMNPFLDYVQEVATNSTQTGNAADVLTVQSAFTLPLPSWNDWYALIGNTGQVGYNTEVGSWLLPRDVIESNPEEVAQALLTIPGLNYYLVAGGAVSKANASAAGIHPAWRKAAAHVVTGIGWSEGTTADKINQLRELLKDRTAKLRALAPDSGAYLNEASLYEPNPAHSFFGSHYQALRAIKAIYDPIDLFVVPEGVGSREWDAQLRCRI